MNEFEVRKWALEHALKVTGGIFPQAFALADAYSSFILHGKKPALDERGGIPMKAEKEGRDRCDKASKFASDECAASREKSEKRKWTILLNAVNPDGKRASLQTFARDAVEVVEKLRRSEVKDVFRIYSPEEFSEFVRDSLEVVKMPDIDFSPHKEADEREKAIIITQRVYIEGVSGDISVQEISKRIREVGISVTSAKIASVGK